MSPWLIGASIACAATSAISLAYDSAACAVLFAVAALTYAVLAARGHT